MRYALVKTSLNFMQPAAQGESLSSLHGTTTTVRQAATCLI